MPRSQEFAYRRYAVVLLEAGRVLSFPRRRLSFQEASAFARTYNRLGEERTAIVVCHPISRAISQARARSRAS